MKWLNYADDNCMYRTYHAVINLEPLVLNIFNIAHIVTRKCSIHNIQVDHQPIEPVYGWFITCPTHIWCQVQDLRESNCFVKLSEFTRLQYSTHLSCKNLQRTKSKTAFFIERCTWNRFKAIVRTFGASNIVNFFLAFS